MILEYSLGCIAMLKCLLKERKSQEATDTTKLIKDVMELIELSPLWKPVAFQGLKYLKLLFPNS